MISRMFLTRTVVDCRRACSLLAGILLAFAAEAAPEIAVISNGFTIADGDTTPNTTDQTDFGGVATISGTIVRTFTITNSGATALLLGSVTIGGTSASDFAVVAQPAATVAANGSTTFQVRFDPSANGLRTASLSFTNNDSDENPFTFSIQGTGLNLAPTISTITNQVINEDSVASIALTVGDAETSADALTLTALTSSSFLIPTNAIVFGGSGSNRTVMLTPVADRNGTATISLIVSDGTAKTTNSFVLTVNPVNDPPYLGSLFSQALPGATDTPQTVNNFVIVFNGGDPEVFQRLSFTVVVTNGAGLFTVAPAIDTNGTLTYTPNGSSGQADMLVTLTDDDTAGGPALSSPPQYFNIVVDTPVDRNYTPSANNSVYNLAMQPDGKLLIGGDFTSLGAAALSYAGRINVDGTIDTGFPPSPDGFVHALGVQLDAQILFGGNFSFIASSFRRVLARVSPAGNLDTAFSPNPNGLSTAFAVQADGRILTAGNFNAIGGGTSQWLARLNTNGTLDTNFHAVIDNTPWSIAVQPDGKIVLVGGFSTVNGAARNNLARLNPDGSLDTNFANPRPNSLVTSVALQADGKILIGGWFNTLLNPVTTRNYVARLNADGTIDTTFDPNANNKVNTIAVQTDGKILLGGEFTSMSGVPRNRIARLLPDGSLQTTFSVDVDGIVRGIALQADGGILIGGDFTHAQGLGRSRLARLRNQAATQSLTVSSNRIQWLRGGTSPESQLVIFDYSKDGANYSRLGIGSRTNGGWQLTGLTLPGGGYIRASAQTTGGYFSGSPGLLEAVTTFGVIPPVIDSHSPTRLANGSFQFSFTNTNNVVFSVLAATNISLPPSNWTVLGAPGNIGGGRYQFIDSTATNYPRRFYLLRFP